MRERRNLRTFSALLLALLVPLVCAQTPDSTSAGQAVAGEPIAIVPLNPGHAGASPTVTGGLQVTSGKAVIAASGQVAAGSRPTDVLLPRRGSLRVCQSTTVRLTAASSSSAGSAPGLMISIDYGAVEINFANAHTTDILLTPDFRIQLGGPGNAELDARVADHGDTCIDDHSPNGPFVLVTSVFDGGSYNVHPGQRVMFHHGSVHAVSDSEKEPCGCPPPAAEVKGNDFPLAQSEGLEPTPTPKAGASGTGGQGSVSPPLVFNAARQTTPNATSPEAVSSPESKSPGSGVKSPGKGGVFHRLGRFFRHVFHF